MKRKGPKIKYFCGDDLDINDCEHLKFMLYYYSCTAMNSMNSITYDTYTVNIKKETPKWCPYLQKVERKLKIEKLNES